MGGPIPRQVGGAGYRKELMVLASFVGVVLLLLLPVFGLVERDLFTRPHGQAFGITDIATALLCFATAVCLKKDFRWAPVLVLWTVGALSYALIEGSLYQWQQRRYPLVALVLLIALVFLAFGRRPIRSMVDDLLEGRSRAP